MTDDFRRFNRSLRLEISDEGPGVPEEKIKTIFNNYTQLDNQQGALSGVEAFSPDGYLSKPFSSKALTDLVAKILEPSQVGG